MSENAIAEGVVWNDPGEYDAATQRERELLAKQPADRRGCPFCGHQDLQTLINPVVVGEPTQPIIPTRPHNVINYRVDLLVCGNCNFVMQFLTSGFEPAKG